MAMVASVEAIRGHARSHPAIGRPGIAFDRDTRPRMRARRACSIFEPCTFIWVSSGGWVQYYLYVDQHPSLETEIE